MTYLISISFSGDGLWQWGDDVCFHCYCDHLATELGYGVTVFDDATIRELAQLDC